MQGLEDRSGAGEIVPVTTLWRAAYRHSLKLRGVPIWRIHLIEIGEWLESYGPLIAAAFVVAASIYAASKALD